MGKKANVLDGEEEIKTELEREEDRLVQIRNEKTRLEREIDILKVRYDDRQKLLSDQQKAFTEKMRLDTDTITRQLHDNKLREERLLKTQSEVNQFRAKIEEDAEKQKRILLEKEVQLDKALQEIKKEKAKLAETFTAA